MILREATEADALLLYQWRNDPSVREQSFSRDSYRVARRCGLVPASLGEQTARYPDRR